ncbi:MAG TPA: MBL fold metallo-hydrolase [Acholeplasmataceae bacterium]|jgi:glyoxylase-like metal-dependent hydrolase (beta-lactamase superfamily II)|nr:MBL fold metallo-hydrolase [Acholeplasmataceae bacterium]
MESFFFESISSLLTSSKSIFDDIYLLNFYFANAYMIGSKERYILVDTGFKNSKFYIKKIIRKHFDNRIPKAIILTHGHFDNIGSAKYFEKEWKIPVYAHIKEIPYISGKNINEKKDEHLKSNLVAKLSKYKYNILLDDLNVKALPEDETIPYLDDWRWIHCPGHTEGHIALFRDKDRTLICGDALMTKTKITFLQSDLLSTENSIDLSKYNPFDYEVAKKSIYKLQQLHPFLLLPSHGKPLSKDKLISHLHFLMKQIF